MFCSCTDIEGCEYSSDSVVWSGAHGVKYSDDFRTVVYKINPNNLSCVYKKMFEATATNNLRGVEIRVSDSDTDKKTESSPKKVSTGDSSTCTSPTKPVTPNGITTNGNNKYKLELGPPNKGQDQIIKSVGAAYCATISKDRNIFKKVCNLDNCIIRIIRLD